MKHPSPRRRSGRHPGGFSLIEVIIAAVFIALIGIAVSMSFLKLTKTSVWNREGKKATTLADMVFERYVVYASSDFVILNTMAVSQVPAATFFGTPDNMGFDNMLITTTITTPSGSPNLRKVALTVTTLNMDPPQTFNFTTYLSPLNTSQGGANVNVYVKTSTGGPIMGAVVTATQFNNASGKVSAVTDETGHAFVQNVQTSADGLINDIPFTANAAGSDSSVPQLAPNYAPGYYAPVGPSRYSATQTLFANIQVMSSTPVIFSQFSPDYSMYGTLVDESASAGAPGMPVQIQGNLVSAGKSSMNQVINLTSSTGVPLGHYELNNIIPGKITFPDLGATGSGYTVPDTDPSYQQGFAGDDTRNPALIPVASGTPPTVPQDLYIWPKGALDITTKDSLTSAPVPNTLVSFTVTIANNPVNIAMPTGGLPVAGELKLYNIIPYQQSIDFIATQTPSGSCASPPYGTYGSALGVNCMPGLPAAATAVPISVASGHQLKAIAVDATTSVPLVGYTVSALALDGTTVLTATTAGDGSFQLCGLAGVSPVHLTFSNSTPMSVTFPAGTVIATEASNDQPIAGATMTGAAVGACPGSAGSVVSGAGGAFPVFCMNTNWQTGVDVVIPAATLPLTTWDLTSTPILVPGTLQVPLQVTDLPYFKTGKGGVSVTGTTASGVTAIQPILAYYPLTGLVQELGSLVPLAGITVTSRSQNTVSTSTGSYSMLGTIQGRHRNPSFAPGTVSATAGPGTATNTGLTYSANNGTSPVSVPATFDLTTPLDIDFKLFPAAGSGTVI